MDYTGPTKTRSIPLLPQLKKQIAYRKLRKGKPVSRFTKGTKKEVKNKLHLVNEAKRLMAQITPCADDAESQNLTFEASEEILYDSDEYIENNTCKDNACEDDTNKEDDTCEYDTCEDDACEDDACEDDACEDDACEDDTCEDDTCEYDTCEDNEIDDCKMQNTEKSNSPIHMHLLENELEYDSNPVCADDASDTSDTEYRDVLCHEDEKNIFQMDEELDIVDNDFQFIK